VPISVRCRFRQRFVVSAREAFEWCTAFDPADHALMGEESAKRQVNRLADGAVLLTDTFCTPKGLVEKQKLVQLFPDWMFWTSTHLTGPNRHSQFLYQISPEGDGASQLDFTALHLEYGKEDLGEAAVKLFAEKLCREDSEAWALLAKAVAKDFGK
jgi:hypothetical protein